MRRAWWLGVMVALAACVPARVEGTRPSDVSDAGWAETGAASASTSAPASTQAPASATAAAPASGSASASASASSSAPALSGACASDSDCSTASDYCTGCICRPLGKGGVLPTCHGKGVQCLVDPCRGKHAVCINGACAIASASAAQ